MQYQLHTVHCILVCVPKKQKSKSTKGVCEQHIRKSTVQEAKEGSSVIKCQTNTEDSRSTNV